MVSIDEMKLPPNNLDAEKAMLCSILLDNESIFICEWFAIKSDDFYLKEHQLLFESILEMFSNRKTIDIITLSDNLVKKWVLEKIWWVQYLYDISLFLPTASWVKEHAKIVKEKSVLRQVLKVAQNIIGEVYEEKEVSEILESIEKKIMWLTQFKLSDSLVHIRDILEWRYEDYFRRSENPEEIWKYVTSSWYLDLDNITGWFKPWELLILAARPSMWKTSLALNIAENAAVKYWKKIAIFSLEMGKDQIADRLISTVSGISMKKITTGDLVEKDFVSIWEALEKLWWVDIFIDDRWWATVQEIKSKLRKLKIEKWGIDLLIIDYLQLMSGTKFVGNRVQEISEVSRWLKEMARELEVPVLALSQLSRAVESRPDKRPHLADLRESWAIEQDADMVMMLYREDYYDPDTDKKWIAELFVRKNRNWPTADV